MIALPVSIAQTCSSSYKFNSYLNLSWSAFHQRSLSPFHLLYLVTLPVLRLQDWHLQYHPICYWSRLALFWYLHQVPPLVGFPQVCCLHTHMSCQQKNLPPFHIVKQMTTLLVDIPQAYPLQPHMIWHWMRLSHLQILLPVYLPVSIPQVFHRHSLLRNHQKNLSQLQLLLLVMLPVYIS